MAKTLIALLIVYWLFQGNRQAQAACGLGVILGHAFPWWNHFNGGKGVAVSAMWIVFFDWRAGLIALIIGLILVILMKNLTIPPLIYMFGYSAYVWINFNWQCGYLFLLASLVMCFKFRKDIVDFFSGNGKRVDVLTTIKKKLGKKVS